MRTSSQMMWQTFTVDVEFFSGDICYAQETYRLDAVTWYAAEQQALQISVSSAYDNPRIPALRRVATARPL
jgi:hypothetical protein